MSPTKVDDNGNLDQRVDDELDDQAAADEIWQKFRELQVGYTTRNVDIEGYISFFDGEHWTQSEEEAEEETQFQLVFNFCRATVMKYAAILSKLPRISVPMASAASETLARARNRERLLQVLFEQLAQAWADAEFNASKKTYGVVQIIWDPERGQPVSLPDPTPVEPEAALREEPSQGPVQTRRRRYTKSPFRMRSIDPCNFYPVYRTWDEADDFLYVVRYDPDRLIEDIEDVYGVSLQPTGQDFVGDGTTDLIEYWDDKQYYLIAYTQYTAVSGQKRGQEEGHAVLLKRFKHKYGRVPFFILQNIRNPDDDPVDGGSLGDIDLIAEINQHYNMMMSEAAEEIATNIHRPLAYKSDDHQQRPEALEMRPGAVYPIGAEEELEPIAWNPMPESVKQHIDAVLTSLKDLSFLGSSGFGEYPTGASGVGLRIILQSLEQILQLKLPIRVRTLKKIACFLLQVCYRELKPKDDGTVSTLALWFQDNLGRFGELTVTANDIQYDHFVDVDYGNLLPRAETEYQQNEVFKFNSGAQSLRTTLHNLGIDDPESEIALIRREREDPVLNPKAVSETAEAKQAQKAAQQATAAPGGGAGMPPSMGGMMGGAGGMAGPGGAGPMGGPPMTPGPAAALPGGGPNVPFQPRGGPGSPPGAGEMEQQRPGPGQNPGQPNANRGGMRGYGK